MTEEKKKTPPRKDRIRAKKKTYKLSEKQVEMIRSQKGKRSVRETARWFQEQTHFVFKVSPSMVHHIFSGRRHAPKKDEVSIYDLIAEEISEEELENLDPKKVNYD
jgi:hypothetical protein